MKPQFFMLFVFGACFYQPTAAQQSFTYFCVVDQVVGVQTQKANSGVIRSDKDKFTLKYTGGEYFLSSLKDENPRYFVPKIETTWLSQKGSMESFYYSDIFSPFSFRGDSYGFLKSSDSYLGAGSSGDKKALERAKLELQKHMTESNKGVQMGTYSSSMNSLGLELIHLLVQKSTIHGIALQSFVTGEKARSQGDRPMVGYVHYFTCDKF